MSSSSVGCASRRASAWSAAVFEIKSGSIKLINSVKYANPIIPATKKTPTPSLMACFSDSSPALSFLYVVMAIIVIDPS